MEQLVQYITELWNTGFGNAVIVLGRLAPIWVPLILLIAFWQIWIKYIRAYNIYNQGSALLEIRLPQEVSRSPRAMEMVITSMFQKSEPEHLLLTYWEGKVPPWFSLELVSIDGYVHFYIWTFKKFKGMIEANLYSQYPNIEVVEVEDYTKPVHYDPNKYEIFGSQFTKSKPSVYPIQTYVDYGLDKAPDEELRDDPMTSMLEYLGSMQKGEQVWIQILIEAHKTEGVRYGRLIPKKDWKDEAKAEIKRLRESVKIQGVDPNNPMAVGNEPLLDSEQNAVKAISHNMDKFPFDACIRAIYLAEKEVFNSANISGLISTLRQFSSNDRNGFSLNWKSDIDELWKDFRGNQIRKREKQILDAYKRRSYFRAPYRYYGQKPFILTTEELATMFHVPGTEAITPTLPRITSRKGQAPSNLPS